MSLQLSDLDELVQKVRTPYAKSYLIEAISAYRTGAYRAAVISTWVSVCVDIIEKIKELSIGNDATAQAIERKLNGIQPNDFSGMQAFEKEILKYACEDLELISHIEKSHLERLKDDRNICAHPTFSVDGSQFVPSPELTRAYIVQAANYLLINLPVRGKVVVDDFFRLINEASFPEEDEKAFTVLSSDKYLGRVKDSSIRNLCIVLLKRLFKDEDMLSPRTINQIASALGAINRIKPDIYSDVHRNKFSRMLAEASDQKLKRVIPFLIRRPDSWGYIDRPEVIRIEGCISTMGLSDLIKYKVVYLASIVPPIRTVFQDIINRENFEGLKDVIKSTPSELLKDKAIELFVNSGSFNSAYSNGMNLLVPHSSYMVDADLRHTFEGIRSNGGRSINQILYAGGIDEVFASLYQGTKEKVVAHSEMWRVFVESIGEDGHSYPILNQLLIDDGVLSPSDENDREAEVEDI